jgi:hypothetical protein
VRAVLPVVLLLVPVLLGAAGIDLAAEVDRTTVALGERLLLTVTATGTDVVGLPQPRLSRLVDFVNRGSVWGRFTSDPAGDTGARRRTVGFVYTLEPKRTGTLTIGPVSLTHADTTYRTKPISVRVVAAGEPVPPFESWAEANGIVLECSADRSDVCVGEPVAVSYRLFARARVGNIVMQDAPGFAGFWSVSLEDGESLDWRPATRRGESCTAAYVRQVVLYPVQTGSLTVERMTLAGTVAVSGGLFDGMPAPFTVSSAPLRVSVSRLPDSGRPADFGGGVGRFAMTARLSKGRSENGEPIRLEVSVTGTGNIRMVGVPRVTAAEGVELLAPTVRQEAGRDGNRVGGTCTYSYAVMPRANGLNVVPAASMSFFDPDGDTYYTLSTGPLEFVAAAVPANRPSGGQGLRAGFVGADIHPIKPSGSRLPPFLGETRWSWLFYPVGIVVLMAGAATGRHRRRLRTDKGYALRSRAGRLANARLRESTARLAAGDLPGFYAALSRAALGLAGDRWNVDVDGLSKEELRTTLLRQGTDAALVERLLEFMSRCDAARFSPGEVGLTPSEASDIAAGILDELRSCHGRPLRHRP